MEIEHRRVGEGEMRLRPIGLACGAKSIMLSTMLFPAGVIACIGFLGSPTGASNVCLPPPPLCEAAASADLVFFGEVLAQTDETKRSERGAVPVDGVQAVKFNVIQAFKGVETGELWGLFYIGFDAPPFKIGARYVVFAHRRATGVFVTGCTLTRELSKLGEAAWARTDAAELRACTGKPR